VTDLPPPPGGPPFEPAPAPQERSRSGVRGPLVVIVGLLVLLGLGAFVGLRLLDSGPDHPDEWDPRVEAIVEWVEDARDLEFEHPVHVDFLSEDAYSDVTRESTDDLDEESLEELEQSAGTMRALGLASGELDLAKALGDVADEGTLAFYDPSDERVRVRGDELTPAMRVTLAHELVHVLQDQHFDLDRVADEEDPAAADAYRALAEGDAGRIEDQYLNEVLDENERAEASADLEGEVGPEGEEPLAGVPDALIAFFATPYLLGDPFVAALAAQDGNEAVDEAFHSPPESEEHVFDVLTFLDGDDPLDVEAIETGDEEPLDEGELGIVTWYLMLASRIDEHRALAAADGWGGDTYAFVERDGSVCVDARFEGDTDADTDEMEQALQAWRAEMPAGPTVERDGRAVLLQACDPGIDVDVEPPTSPLDALQLPAIRGLFVADALTVFTQGVARCYADTMTAQLTVEQIADPPPGFIESVLPRMQQDAITDCQ
jgi:hypothetical protein